MSKLYYGVGIFDGGYVPVIKKELPKVNGKRKRLTIWVCPFYQTWSNMLQRITQTNRNCYIECSVCQEWLTFSKFKAWMETQEWQGKQLDKDLLGNGKLYSPDTCLFIDKKINVFISDKQVNVNGLKGVIWQEDRGKYQAQIKDLYTKKCLNLGRFETVLEAHLAWKTQKHKFACILAETVSDIRVANALRDRYK